MCVCRSNNKVFTVPSTDTGCTSTSNNQVTGLPTSLDTCTVMYVVSQRGTAQGGGGMNVCVCDRLHVWMDGNLWKFCVMCLCFCFINIYMYVFWREREERVCVCDMRMGR